ncbi:MAG: N-6 DNA methylase [Nitrospiria bacterium]
MQTEYHKEFEKTIRSVSYSKHLWEIFSDFVEMAAISLSNAIYLDPDKEKRYLDLAGRYQRNEISILPKLLGITINALEGTSCDFLGEMFMQLELASHYHGQFFTPFPICKMMADMNLVDIEKTIESKGYVTCGEPCVGAGAMVIALAKSCMEKKINYQEKVHVTAIDISPVAAHMAYIQLTLLHVPAIVYIGNSLSMEMCEKWVTPAHVMGFWDSRLKRDCEKAESPKTDHSSEPVLLFPPDISFERPEVKEPAFPMKKKESPVIIQPSLFV